MMDPPRSEAIQAVKEVHEAGINVIMITGDHPQTAFSIAKMMDIVPQDARYEDVVLKGTELYTLTDTELIKKVKEIKVFARVEPEQKLRIVDALQSRGEIVAMTGDGVNDAPALKQANIGVAMGLGGTEVAKEASDMILSDDNFSSIAHAVKEGRNVFDNLVKFITWTLPTNLGEGLVILFAIMLGISLPILPVQILWINMSTAILLGLMLVFEPKEEGIMNRPPRDPSQPILTKPLIYQMLVVGFYMLIASFVLYSGTICSYLCPTSSTDLSFQSFAISISIGSSSFLNPNFPAIEMTSPMLSVTLPPPFPRLVTLSELNFPDSNASLYSLSSDAI